jgi:hypothetical protein
MEALTTYNGFQKMGVPGVCMNSHMEHRIILEVMKWLFNHGCPWDGRTFSQAALLGNICNMKWMHENKCPRDENIFAEAAIDGTYGVMKCPWDARTCSNTATHEGQFPLKVAEG